MKTIKYKMIDDYKVVTNISSAHGFVDPEATRIIVEKEFEKTEIFRKISDLKNQQGTYHEQALAAYRNAYNAKIGNNHSEMIRYTAAYQDMLAKEKETMKPLSELSKKKNEIVVSLFREHAQYFTLPANEELISDDDAEEFNALMIEATAENKLVTLDKQKISDLRKNIYWRKNSGTWVKTEIMRIGENKPSGGRLFPELTESEKIEVEEQIENDRIATLTVTARAGEKSEKIATAKAQAITMRSGLEIEGDIEALTKAQEWLAEELEKIDLIYS